MKDPKALDPQLMAAYPKAVIQELRQTLQEIGPIQPIWDEDCQEYGVSHPLYPSIEAPGDTPEECIQAYHRMLAKFLSERMQDNLAPHVEKMTPGRGGKRPGAGRPKALSATVTVRLPMDIAAWLKANPEHLDQVRKLMV